MEKKNQLLHRVLSLFPTISANFHFCMMHVASCCECLKSSSLPEPNKDLKYYLVSKSLDLSAHRNSFNTTIKTSRTVGWVLYKKTHTHWTNGVPLLRKSNAHDCRSTTRLAYYIHTFKWNMTRLLLVFWSAHEWWLFLNSLSYWASLCAGHSHWHDNIGFSFTNGRRPGPLNCKCRPGVWRWASNGLACTSVWEAAQLGDSIQYLSGMTNVHNYIWKIKV